MRKQAWKLSLSILSRVYLSEEVTHQEWGKKKAWGTLRSSPTQRLSFVSNYIPTWVSVILGLLGKRGLVSCLSSSQKDFSVLWLEPSWALLGRNKGIWKLDSALRVYQSPYLHPKCKSFSDQMVPNRCVLWFLAELFIPKIKEPKVCTQLMN